MKIASNTAPTNATVLGSLDFVRYYPGKPVPENKTSLDLLEQEIVSGNGITLAICKS